MFVSRRSIRKYKNYAIEPEKLNRIMSNTLFSPTARNRKHCEFVITQDKEKISYLSKSRETSSQFLKEAPCAVVILANKDISDVWVEDASIAAFALQLAAHIEGLGTCWCQIRLRNYNDSISSSEYIKELFGIPERYEVECIIGMGYPDEIKVNHEMDEELSSKVHFEKF